MPEYVSPIDQMDLHSGELARFTVISIRFIGTDLKGFSFEVMECALSSEARIEQFWA